MGSDHDNVASAEGERMYSGSPRGIMVITVMGGGKRVVQFCYIGMAGEQRTVYAALPDNESVDKESNHIISYI